MSVWPSSVIWPGGQEHAVRVDRVADRLGAQADGGELRRIRRDGDPLGARAEHVDAADAVEPLQLRHRDAVRRVGECDGVEVARDRDLEDGEVGEAELSTCGSTPSGSRDPIRLIAEHLLLGRRELVP